MQEQDLAELKDLRIAQRLRNEHLMLREITANLKAVACQIPDSNRRQWFAELKNRYEQFRAHMTKRIALEEVGGFMTAVEQRQPSFAPQIEHLRQAHGRILTLINSVHQELAELDPSDTETLNNCRVRIEFILSEVNQHERSEEVLVGFLFAPEFGEEG
ncbi:MAG: hemerythrin domain-containing protein [Phycisphaerae bacterium]|nr:hemerythrin domain-containing protein [Phycisphaerae bacterium]